MLPKTKHLMCAFAGLLALACAVRGQATSSRTDSRVDSPAQRLIDTAASEGKYSFVLFYRNDDETTKAMNSVLNQSISARPGTADIVYAQITDPKEQALVAKHGVARAPMPFLVVLAPNGAVSGIFAQKLTAANIEDSYVTPTMMIAMKSLQAGKLVLVSIQGSLPEVAPAAMGDFQADAHFKDRLTTATVRASDPKEAKFLSQVKIDARTLQSHLVLMAPPGVLVGKFESSATKDQIAAALAKAGKCCDDPNCKHHQAPPRSAKTPEGNSQR